MPKSILIVDDHVAVRQGLERIFHAEFPGARIGLAADGLAALQLASEANWSVAILDLNIPGRGGLELIQDLKSGGRVMKILVYSMHHDEEFGVRALTAGAEGYVSKDRPAEDLIAAIRKLITGKKWISDVLAERLADVVTGDAPASSLDLLSNREREVLRLYGQGKTSSEIAHLLNKSVKTISTYRSRILIKLKLRTTADLIRYAIEHKLND
jgi:two-component system, NarL family, invasion response regulator UvrY